MAKTPRVPVENQISTLIVVKIAIKFSTCIKIYINNSFGSLDATYHEVAYVDLDCAAVDDDDDDDDDWKKRLQYPEVHVGCALPDEH